MAVNLNQHLLPRPSVSTPGALSASAFKTRSMMALGLAIGAVSSWETGPRCSRRVPWSSCPTCGRRHRNVVSVMLALAELASPPTTGSFSAYAEADRSGRFYDRVAYWVMLIMVFGLEVTGAAKFFVGWFPECPAVVALVIAVVIGGINPLAAGQYGEIGGLAVDGKDCCHR